MYTFKHMHQHNQKWNIYKYVLVHKSTYISSTKNEFRHFSTTKNECVFLATHKQTYAHADICVFIKAPRATFLHTTKKKKPQSRPKKIWTNKWQNKMNRRLFIFARHCVRPQGTRKGSFVLFFGFGGMHVIQCASKIVLYPMHTRIHKRAPHTHTFTHTHTHTMHTHTHKHRHTHTQTHTRTHAQM